MQIMETFKILNKLKNVFEKKDEIKDKRDPQDADETRKTAYDE